METRTPLELATDPRVAAPLKGYLSQVIPGSMISHSGDRFRNNNLYYMTAWSYLIVATRIETTSTVDVSRQVM